jgi:hypothetical protein
MAAEFLAMLFFVGLSIYIPPGVVRGPYGPGPGPSVPPPWLKIIGNIYIVILAGLLTITVVTHPEQAFSLPYGAFTLVPAINIVVGLYYNNAPAPAAEKVKA